MGKVFAPGSPFTRAASGTFNRQRLIFGSTVFAASGLLQPLFAKEPIRFGLTPVFLSNDLQLLAALEHYLAGATGAPVQLISRRTYQEITALLVSAQLDGAWICGYPFVQFRDRLDLMAVPVWRGRPLYQSCLIVRKEREVTDWRKLKGDIHAFSDPDSNSGFLATRALLARNGLDPQQFFRRFIFTYGHRNVIRAVASGLCQSGSVDGYVLEVLREVEPGLGHAVKVVRASAWFGFPPIASPKSLRRSPRVKALEQALLEMHKSADGRRVLQMLRLEGFTRAPESLFDSIAANMMLVGSLG